MTATIVPTETLETLLLEDGSPSLLEGDGLTGLEANPTNLDASPTLFAPRVTGGIAEPVLRLRYREQRHPIFRQATQVVYSEQHHVRYLEELPCLSSSCRPRS